MHVLNLQHWSFTYPVKFTKLKLASTQLGFMHNWVIAGFQWMMLHRWLLVQLGQDKQFDNMFECKKEHPMDGRYDAYDHHDLVACIWNSSWNLTLGILASGEGQNPFAKDNVIYHMDWHTGLNSSHIWITHKTMGHRRAWWVSYFTFHFTNQKLFFYYLQWEMLSPLVGCTSNLNMYSSGTLLFSSYFSYN